MNNTIAELRDLNLELESLKARKNAIKTKLAEHRDSFTDEEIANSTNEAKEIRSQIESVQQKINDAQNRAKLENEKRGDKNYMENENKVDLETRANEFVRTNRTSIRGGKDGELRAALLSTGTLKPLSNQVEINDIANNGISTILDNIYIQDLYGTGGNEIPYVVSESTAGVGTEGQSPAESEPVFGVIKVTPITVDTIAYVSRRIKKLSPVQYENKVRELALKALRKKVIELVSTGAAGTASGNNITVSGVEGIKNSTLNQNYTLSTSDIGATTLREIVLNYGGDDEVSGAAILQLCKTDLQKFGAVRGANEKKAVYEITIEAGNPNAGTIKDGGTIVPFKINSNLEDGTMVYGQMPHYELDTYGDYEITTSEDYKFAEGLIAIKGSVDVSGAVTAKGGFMVINGQA